MVISRQTAVLQKNSQCLLPNILINGHNIFFSLSRPSKKKNTQKSKERKFDETVGGKGIKETPAQMISRDHCKMLKHTYIEKNLQMTASVDSFTTFIAI